MGIFDFLFRRDDEEDAQEMPEEPSVGGESSSPIKASHDFEPGAGGKHFYSRELSNLRWGASADAVSLSRSHPDPANWRDGRMQFELERSVAHDHEALRDQLSNAVAARLAVEAAAVYSAALDVGHAREALRSTDEELARVTVDWRRKYRLAEADPMEIGRLYRLQSWGHRGLKALIAVTLILVELVLTANVFAKLFRGVFDVPAALVGSILAFGIIILLIVVPHYAAIGIKEGISKFHSFERFEYDRRDEPVPVQLRRMEDRERKEDLVFKWTAALMSVLLLAVIMPLSWLRAADIKTGLAPTWVWFLLYVAVQLGISLFFFFQEWKDYGPFSQDLYNNHKDLQRLSKRRSDDITHLRDTAEWFHGVAEDLLFTLQEASRWDNNIVETYLGTIHHIRNVIGETNVEIRPFITGAVVPYLGTRAEAAESDYPLEALSLENASLESDRPFGRNWRIKRVGEEWVTDFESPDGANASDQDVAWMLTKTPMAMLEEVLDRYFDLPAKYIRPAVLDGPHADPDEIGWVPSELPDPQPVFTDDHTDTDDAAVIPDPDGDDDSMSSAETSPDIERALAIDTGLSPAEDDEPPSIAPSDPEAIDRTIGSL